MILHTGYVSCAFQLRLNFLFNNSRHALILLNINKDKLFFSISMSMLFLHAAASRMKPEPQHIQGFKEDTRCTVIQTWAEMKELCGTFRNRLVWYLKSLQLVWQSKKSLNSWRLWREIRNWRSSCRDWAGPRPGRWCNVTPLPRHCPPSLTCRQMSGCSEELSVKTAETVPQMLTSHLRVFPLTLTVAAQHTACSSSVLGGFRAQRTSRQHRAQH